ncbi:exopolysaccharide biosynthesis protein [Methylobacterium gnaphalii]|uniref:Exopolysaccharide biosynthesis protein n=1 Tax=Methylobacterium gnaphalii TaxID=1010610 RepID=A0A512JKL8_9HYPH|nr:exopolysaccharide biosynthesis protein [Methylobacterium gnaphalii]GLS47929.1 exopolysaccharide biosynthesis protein [Methylobacterium gnaphalii]
MEDGRARLPSGLQPDDAPSSQSSPSRAPASDGLSATAQSPGLPFGSSITADDVVATTLFLAVFLFFWISITPFVDLTDPAVLLPQTGSNTANQAVVIGLAGSLVLYAVYAQKRWFTPVLNTPLILLFAWLVVSTATSIDPSLSGRRVVLTAIVFVIVAVTLLLPKDVERFADLIAAAALIVLVISYGGVMLAPHYAVHQAGELLEPEHAGHWRGPFTHKNGAGAAMVMCVFMGLYVARRRSAFVGWFITAAAALFLVCSMAKTSIALLLPSLLLAWVISKLRSTSRRLLVVGGLLSLLLLLTVGSVLVPVVASFNASVMADPSFTNRTDIWRFAFSAVAARPIFGSGFEAFWGSEDVFFGESTSWANRAANSHDGYLDVLLGTGFPGLCIVVWLFIVEPIRNLKIIEDAQSDPVTALFFTQLWIYGVFFAGLETFFFTNGGPVWFMFLMAILGLQFQAKARHRSRSVSTP